VGVVEVWVWIEVLGFWFCPFSARFWEGEWMHRINEVLLQIWGCFPIKTPPIIAVYLNYYLYIAGIIMGLCILLEK
jgi:hypothetical protein